jgi:hypothetical protein
MACCSLEPSHCRVHACRVTTHCGDKDESVSRHNPLPAAGSQHTGNCFCCCCCFCRTCARCFCRAGLLTAPFCWQRSSGSSGSGNAQPCWTTLTANRSNLLCRPQDAWQCLGTPFWPGQPSKAPKAQLHPAHPVSLCPPPPCSAGDAVALLQHTQVASTSLAAGSSCGRKQA